TRVLGVPVPLHRDFEEVNLRFYVRRRGPEGWRRGVVFVREIVPRWAIATVARVVYNEQYAALPMRHRIGPFAGGREVEYGWRWRGRWNGLRAVTVGGPRPLVPGSEEEFVTEHYWGYTARSRGPSAEYRVEHPAWRTWRVSEAALDCDVATLYGPAFVEALSAPPRSAFVAEGSPVRVLAGARL
ncbi:MAG TPA: DUF2071 domain-containing protein, partial [Longimicrobiaceae bacterium]|nr:DUF2071 domain-containing protein [Longimicrobiaceae bacterium]